MASDGEPPLAERTLIPLFLGKQRQNIAFVLDTSEDTSNLLGSVKHLLIQTLLTKACLRDSFFNIVTFSYKVNCWSHHMLPCAPHTVYEALSWIHTLSCSPGRDLLAALSTALTDPACDTIHLLIRGLPDHPEAVLQALPRLAAGRPVNVFHLGPLDSRTPHFLQCLTLATRGSCFFIPIGLSGALEKVIPLCITESQTSVPTISTMTSYSQSTSAMPCQHVPFPLLGSPRCNLGNSFCPVTPCVLSSQAPGSAEFLPGCRVLARQELDGLYYLGTVIQEVQGRKGLWVVEFDCPGSTDLGITSSKVSRQQLVCSLDMVNYTRAHARCPAPGEAVLSPWEPDRRRYGPGRVLAGMEWNGDFLRAEGGAGLRVLMWNGCVSQVPGDLTVYISTSHHHRITRELQTATSVASCHCNWPCVHSSSCTTQLCCTQCCQSAPTSCHRPIVHQWPSIVPPTCACSPGDRDRFERAELQRKVDLLLENLKHTDIGRSEPEAPSSSSTVSENETRVMLTPSVKLRSEQERPPWRYWRRNAPEPQHRKPGNSVTRRTFHPARFSFPVLQINALPNHSSLFQPLPGSAGRGANIRDVFEMTDLRPRPPAGFKSLPGNTATAVYT